MTTLAKIATAIWMIRHWTNPKFWSHLSGAFQETNRKINATTWIYMKLKIDSLPNEVQT